MTDDFLYGFLRRPKVPVANLHNTECPPGGVMMIASGGFTVDGDAAVNITQPTSSFQRLYLVNCGATIPANGGTGWGTSLGEPGPLAYTGAGPFVGESWGAVPSSWLAGQHRPGFLISDEGDGAGLAIATQSLVNDVYGVPTGLIEFIDFGTVIVLSGTPNAESSSGMTISSVFNPSRDIPSGEPVRVIWPNGKPMLLPFYQQITLTVRPLSQILMGNSGQCLVYIGGVSTGTQVFAQALGATVEGGRWCVAWQEAVSGQWYVGPWECG